jgi:hypothetical protein
MQLIPRTLVFAANGCTTKKNRFDGDKDYSNKDLTKDSLSLDDAMKNLKKFGLKEVPIIKSIPLSHYIIDMLHLNSRITDVLIDLFFIDLQTCKLACMLF